MQPNPTSARQHDVTTLGTRDAGGVPAFGGTGPPRRIGDLNVPIAATYPLSDVRAAYHALADDRPFGRIVLHPQEQ